MSNNIRNFCVLSHIDHGKSTLADRFLELTDTVSKEKITDQYLDSMDLEKEKGITIKMHPVRMSYQGYVLNLIDTPGHIDFSYETSRALACVEGALLLVDAVKGIQAQTLFNLNQARKQGLKIIGVVNKMDIASQEQIDQAKKELAQILEQNQEEIFVISAKLGKNIEQLLAAVIQRIDPPFLSDTPHRDRDIPVPTLSLFKALVFDSQYDLFSGVIAYIRVFEGQINKGDKVELLANNCQTEIKEVGYFTPKLTTSIRLKTGEIGYVKTGIKEPSKVRVGDTLISASKPVFKGVSDENYPAIKPLSGYAESQPVLFISLYPTLDNDFEMLKDGLAKLKLNDPALIFQPESKRALGRGFRVGFLGSLHAEITVRRLKAEFNLDLALSVPQVIFKVVFSNNKELFVASSADWPEPSQIERAEEPWVKIEIITPQKYFNTLFKSFKSFNISLNETKPLTEAKLLLFGQAPLRKIISGAFYDKLKSISQGYASFSFSAEGYREADLVKMDILIAGQKEESFSEIVPREEAFFQGKKLLQKLKTVLPPQMFAVSLQAVLAGKIIARETIGAKRKDVTASLYGGDVTRKNKLLQAQKKGKKKLKERAKINIPPSAFLAMLKD